MKRHILVATLLAGLATAGTAWGENPLLDPPPFGPGGTSLRSTAGETRVSDHTPDKRAATAAPIGAEFSSMEATSERMEAAPQWKSRSLDDLKVWWR